METSKTIIQWCKIYGFEVSESADKSDIVIRAQETHDGVRLYVTDSHYWLATPVIEE